MCQWCDSERVSGVDIEVQKKTQILLDGVREGVTWGVSGVGK